MILTALGWIAALGLVVLTGFSVSRAFRDKSRGSWTAAGLYACGAVCLLAVDGILAPLTAGVLAFLALAGAAGLAVAEGRKNEAGWQGTAKGALGHAGAGVGYFGAEGLDVHYLWDVIRDGYLGLASARKLETGNLGSELSLESLNLRLKKIEAVINPDLLK